MRLFDALFLGLWVRVDCVNEVWDEFWRWSCFMLGCQWPWRIDGEDDDMCDVDSENDDDFQDNGRIVWQNERIVPALSVSSQISELLRAFWLKSFFRVTFPLSQKKDYKECEKSRKSSTLLSCWRKNQGRPTGSLLEALEWRKTWWAQCFSS